MHSQGSRGGGEASVAHLGACPKDGWSRETLGQAGHVRSHHAAALRARHRRVTLPPTNALALILKGSKPYRIQLTIVPWPSPYYILTLRNIISKHFLISLSNIICQRRILLNISSSACWQQKWPFQIPSLIFVELSKLLTNSIYSPKINVAFPSTTLTL